MDKPVDHNRITKLTACPSQEMLFDYIEGKTSVETTRSIELHLAVCPLCSDAVEGLSMMGGRGKLEKILEEGRQQLFGQTTLVQLPGGKSTAPARKKVQRYLYIGIAASLALILVSYFGIRYLGMSNVQKETISLKSPAAHERPYEQTAPPNGSARREEQNVEHWSPVSGKDYKEVPTGKSGTGGDLIQGVTTTEYAENDQQKESIADVTVSDDRDFSGNLDAIFFSANRNLQDTEAPGIFLPNAGDPLETVENERTIVMEDVVTTLSGEKAKEDRKDANDKKNESVVTGGVVFQNGITTAETKAPQRWLNRGLEAYNKGEYTEATDEFKEALEESPDQAQALYYNGMSYYYLKKYNEAIQSFNTLLKDKKNVYYQAAQWQIAMIYIETGNTKVARKTLNEIIDGNGSYRNPAEEAIKNLGDK